MPTSKDIVSQMRQALSVTEPSLDTNIGTPIRKILDAFGDQISQVYSDRYLLNFQYDIDTKTGQDLDDFVGVFGFTRHEAKRAAGTVVFTTSGASPFRIVIPLGTQLSTADTPPVIVATAATGVIAIGGTEVEIPVRAVLGGSTSNVAAGTITQWVQPVAGIDSFSNPVALSGGTSRESDDDLRTRFKLTIFRNHAGTEDQYVGTALEDADVSQVNVIGATKRHSERVQIISPQTSAFSSIQHAKYVYPDNAIFGPDIGGDNILSEGVHYTFNPSSTPLVTLINGTPDGIFDWQFDYTPVASRNDPPNGITNRIDIYVNGVRQIQAVETLFFSSQITFDSVTSSPYYFGNFRRKTGAPADPGNYFINYSFGPVTDAGGTSINHGQLTIASVVYNENVDYYMINDISPNGGYFGGFSGIEWISSGNGAITARPTDGTSFVVQYLFNEVPRSVTDAIQAWRQVSTDVRVHQARKIFLRFFMAVIVSNGSNLATVQTDVFNALSLVVSNVGFNGTLQISDLLTAAGQVTGVDAIRFLNAGDDLVNFGIQQLADDGFTIINERVLDDGGSPARAVDLILSDNETPVLDAVILSARAQNTFGAL